MASLVIRNIEEPLKARLRMRAAGHGHSMEEEARQILRGALGDSTESGAGLAEIFRRHFAPLGGVDLPAVEREPMREPPSFDE
jgi:plasmid stability protein